MTRTLLRLRLGCSILCLAGMAYAAGCTDAESTEPSNNPSFTLALNPASLTISAGGSATILPHGILRDRPRQTEA